MKGPVIILSVTLLLVKESFSANAPGVEWEKEWVEKIRGKMEFLWDRTRFIKDKLNMDHGVW